MKTKQDETAIVIFSGGQDSTTVLAGAKKLHKNVHAIAFAYDQRHSVELDQAHKIAALMEVPLSVVRLDALTNMRSSALVDTATDTCAEHPYLTGRPATFVPARNAMFITAAYGFAMELGAGRIYLGVCETDYSGYPDCRETFIRKMETALNIGYENDIRLVTPLMHLTKGETFALAEELDCLRIVTEHSHTCYAGDRDERNEWGYGCGRCPACELRAKGWEEYRAKRNAMRGFENVA